MDASAAKCIGAGLAAIGMIGAGITYPPMEAFEKALLAFARQEGVAG